MQQGEKPEKSSNEVKIEKADKQEKLPEKYKPVSIDLQIDKEALKKLKLVVVAYSHV